MVKLKNNISSVASKVKQLVKDKLFSLANKLIMRDSKRKIKELFDIPLAKIFLDVHMGEMSLKRFFYISVFNRYVAAICFFLVSLTFCAYKVGNYEVARISKKLEITTKTLSKTIVVKDSNVTVLKSQLSTAESEFTNFQNSIEFKRYTIFKESGVHIPYFVPKEDVECMIKYSNQYKIPHCIFFRIPVKESRYYMHEVSPVGAKGYFQIMPYMYERTLAELGHPNKSKNELNIWVAAKMLQDLHRLYYNGRGNDIVAWKKALAVYLGGSDYQKTMQTALYQDYSSFILAYYVKTLKS